MRQLLEKTLKVLEDEDRGIGLEPLIKEFVDDVPSLSNDAKEKRIESLTNYYSTILNTSNDVRVAYNQTRKWAIRIYVQNQVKAIRKGYGLAEKMFGEKVRFYQIWTKNPDSWYDRYGSYNKAKKAFDEYSKSGKYGEVHFEEWAGEKLEDGDFDGDYVKDIKIYRKSEKSVFEALDKNKLGQCYILSGRFVMDNPDWELVHGTITRQDGSGYTIGHAWAEKTKKVEKWIIRTVFDPVWEKELTWEDYVYKLGAKEEKRYTHDEMVHILAKERNWGPWH